ncbi:MAG: [Fe-S]-binding protein, partial [Planctomycetales bacterium]|nr:[Fe-S]-binding protein [Planctomycetales bacterium]
DHVIVCNRIKPHTDFTGDIQSGLMKMMLIGLGKHDGAKIYHKAIQDFSFGQIVRSVASEVVERCKIAGGIAIVENALDQTEIIQAVQPADFERHEKELLQMAIQMMARLPFEHAHILLVDRIGKNISGTGMDTNVVGRKHNDHEAIEGEVPNIKRIVIRGLTEETHGNACGIGMCEFARTDVVEQVDFAKTATNCITSNHVGAGMIPLHFATDREILDQALTTIGLTQPRNAKLMWIRDTLDLEYLECSEAYYAEAADRDDLEIVSEPADMQFDEIGDLVRPESAAV